MGPRSRRRRRDAAAGGLRELNRRVVACERCPRLIRHCRQVAREKRAAYRDDDYWGRPVPTTGRADARLWIVGLAPAAHGANRTGRMFTGDRSGDFLYEALHRAGFATRPVSEARDDGTRLVDCAIGAVARCAPPGNRPTAAELARCRPFLEEEWERLTRVRVILALGGLAHGEVLGLYRRRGLLPPGPRPRFAHGARYDPGPGAPLLLASYHVSQQNTFTGRLTQPMLGAVLATARRALAAGRRGSPDVARTASQVEAPHTDR